MKCFYVVDVVRRVRLRGYHTTLEAALNKANKLNRANDKANGKTCARYCCGDWCSLEVASKFIDEKNEWPWEEDSLDGLKNLCEFMIAWGEREPSAIIPDPLNICSEAPK